MEARAKKRHKLSSCKPSLLVSECCISQLTSKFLSCSDIAHLACVCMQLLNALRHTTIDVSHVDLTFEELNSYFGRRTSQWSLVGASVVGHQPDHHSLSMLEGVVLRDLHTLTLKELTDISALGSCSNLHTLNLISCWQVTDISVLGSCSNLHALALFNNDQLTDISALGSCSNLHTLDLSYCWQVTDISALGSCSNLHTLHLSCCWQLTDISALGSCSNLHTLNLSFCRQVTDISALGSCLYLRTLNLVGCNTN
jgi:Leucine Rich repeats (2 copies)